MTGRDDGGHYGITIDFVTVVNPNSSFNTAYR